MILKNTSPLYRRGFRYLGDLDPHSNETRELVKSIIYALRTDRFKKCVGRDHRCGYDRVDSYSVLGVIRNVALEHGYVARTELWGWGMINEDDYIVLQRHGFPDQYELIDLSDFREPDERMSFPQVARYIEGHIFGMDTEKARQK